ncbi:MAG: hypothetical protein D8M55_00105 [Chloroflexi bacterium]|nr:hypothetical protein [Chloroflexota bacterium]
MLRRCGIGQLTRHDRRLLDDMQDLPGAVIHPDGKDLAGTAFRVIFNHLKCQMIARCTSATAIVVIVIPTAFLSASFTSSTCGANDASIRLKGTGWGSLCQDG